MNDDQIRKLKNAGASDLEIERLVIAGVVDNMGVSEEQAYIIANNTIPIPAANPLPVSDLARPLKTSRPKPLPPISGVTICIAKAIITV